MKAISEQTSDPARLLDLLAAVRRVLGPEIAVEPGGEAIATTQFLALRALANQDRTASDLARALGVRLPTLTQLADGLVTRGWIERHDDPDDRRRVRLGLTDSGRQVYRSARECAEARMARILDHIEPSEGKALVRGLEALRGALREMAAQTGGRVPPGR
jgi:DNA-binding MarR family transcriptional regulator